MLTAPFPYFGGKKKIAPEVWKHLNTDVKNYVEPFGGSLAVLLARPEYEGKIETVNEINPYISNFWRAIKHDPEQVASYADDIVSEMDLHARHKWLIAQADFKASMLADPDYFNAKVAGWWVWGISAWIGSGWCKKDQSGLPRVAGDKSTHGTGVHSKSNRSKIYDVFTELSTRLRYVRITCGDWKRVTNAALRTKYYQSALFLDPPYMTSSDLYTGVSTDVAKEVLDFCIANWNDPNLRIVYCGYDGDLAVPNDWHKITWTGVKGYQGADNHNRKKECIWVSPGCFVEKPKKSALQEAFLGTKAD